MDGDAYSLPDIWRYRMRECFPCDDDMTQQPTTADDLIIHQVGWLLKTYWGCGFRERASIMLFDGTDYDP